MILDNEDILIQSAIDSARYEMVDLGLSVKWANKNVGASSPEDTGLYFQWGDTIGYPVDQVSRDKVFDWNNYKFGTISNLTKYNPTDGLKVLESIDDAATTHMGSQYRMPTYTEIHELINNTTQTFIDVDGNEYDKLDILCDYERIESGKLKGVRFTGSNGNSIFIPAAGSCWSLSGVVGMSGRLWSSDLGGGYGCYARNLYFGYNGCVNDSVHSRHLGLSIRGVEFKL